MSPTLLSTNELRAVLRAIERTDTCDPVWSDETLAALSRGADKLRETLARREGRKTNDHDEKTLARASSS